MPDKNGLYYGSNDEDYVFLLEHFVKGTKWFIYEWGIFLGVFTVGDRYEMGGMVRNYITRDRDGSRQQVFLMNLVAAPYTQD